MNYSLLDLAKLVQGVVVGDEEITVSSLSPIDNISAGTLVFADSEDHIKVAEASQAAALLVADKVTQSSKPLIKVPHPLKAFIRLLQHFNPRQSPSQGIHPSAVISPEAQIGKNVCIGPFVIIESGCKIGNNCILKSHIHIGHNVTLGDDTTIHPQVTVYDNTQIGSRVTIHASSVIGSDGFGYTYVDNQHLKVPHIGNVIIEDDVEIGANTAIDRATIGSTVIGAGTKIDNLVQIAHSVKLGKDNILCAFTGIAGSTTTGNHVIFAANVGVSDHVKIDDDVILGARAGVPPHKHLKEGVVYLGNPARPKEKAIEIELSANRIPFIRKNIKTLSEKVSELDKRLNTLETE